MLLIAALLSAVLVSLSAMPASAHTPAANPTCESLEVSATSYSGGASNHVTVVVDGETVADESFGDSYRGSFPWSPTVDHTWEVTIDQGDGDQFDYHASGTQTACEVPPPTEVHVGAEPTLDDVCGVDYALHVPADGEGYRFSTDESGVVDGVGTIVVTATLLDGFVWEGGDTAPRTWTFDVTNEPCTVEGSEPTAPTSQDVCGPEYGLTVPADTEAYRYTVDETGVVDGAGTVVVTATLQPGFTWPGGGTEVRTWELPVTDEPCDVPVVGVATADVVVTGATCTAPGTAATGTIENASWTSQDVPTAGGRATFVATANEGAAFQAGQSGVSADQTTRTFVVDVPAAGGESCTTAPPPVEPPTQATPPVTTVSTPPTLPRTGFDVSAILALGALLAAAGATLVVRRVRQQG